MSNSKDEKRPVEKIRKARPSRKKYEPISSIAAGENTLDDRGSMKKEKYRDHLEELIKERTAELTKTREVIKLQAIERKRTEQVLREIEREQSIVLDSLFDLIVYRNNDMETVWASKSMADWHGMTQEQIIGRVCYKARFGRNEPCEDCHIVEAMKSGKRHELEKQLPDGKFWHVIVNPAFDDCGKVVGTIEVSQDITERKQSEEALRETTGLLETILDHTHMLVAYLDRQFNFVQVNRAYAEADERRPSFFPGKNHFDLYPHAENERIFRRVVETGESYFAYAKPFEYAENPERGISYWDWSLVPIKQKQGIVTGLVLTLADVTARKRAEEALQASEGKLSAMLQSIADPMSMMDVDLNIIWANEKAMNIFGDDIVGRKCYEAYHGREKPCEPYPCLSLRAIHDGNVHEHDTQVVAKDGKTKHFHCSANVALRDEQGKPTAVLEISKDITDQKFAEHALRESENSYRAVVENAAEGIVVVQDQMFQFVNPALVSMMGYSEKELLTRPFIEFVHPDHKEWAIGIHIKRLKGEKVPPVYELKILDKKGNTIWVENNGVLIECRDKPATLNFLRDVTERKKAEQAQKESEIKFRSITEESLVGVYVIQDGVFIYINPKFAEIFGYSVDELINKKGPEELIHPDDWPTSKENLRKRIAGELNSIQYTFRGITKNKEVIHLEVYGSATKYQGHPAVIGTLLDITERVLAEQALQGSKEHFRAIYENALVGLYRTTPDGRILMANPALVQMLGYSSFEELAQLNLEGEGFPRDYQRSVFKQRVEAEDRIVGLESRWMRRDGTTLFVRESSRTVRDKDGEILYYEGTVADITEHKRAEEALKESEEKFRSLAEQSPNMIFINRKGRIVYANKKCEEVTGYKREELCSPDFDFYILAAPESLDLINENLARHLRGEEVRPYDYCLINKDGKRIETINASKLIQYEGETAILGVVTDITERKRAEQALRESEERLRILFESAPDTIYLVDSEGRFMDANRAAFELIGFARDEVIGKSLAELDLLSPRQLSKAKDNLKKVVTSKLSGPNEYRLKRKDGTYISVEVQTFPVKIEGKMLSLGIARDITERKRTEKELLEHQAKLKSLASQLSLTEERERHRLATDLHDQISQSLVISKIKLDQLRKSSTSDEFNKPLEDVCNCLGQIIDDTRTLTFDLSYPILYELGFEAAVAEWLTDQIQEKHGIRTEFVDDGHQKPLDDDIRVLLFRNVRELLINVVKHAQANKVRVSIRKVKDNISVSVEDDGAGFDPVEVTSMAAKRAEFGLFSIRERLEQLGGLIEIDSKPGRGSKITMTAPLKNEDQADGI